MKKYALNDRFSKGVRKAVDSSLNSVGTTIYRLFPAQKGTLDKVADFGGRKVNIAKSIKNKFK